MAMELFLPRQTRQTLRQTLFFTHGVLKMTIDEDHCLANIEPGRGPYCFGVARKLFSHRVAHSHTSDVLSPNIASGRGALLLRGCAQAFFRTGLPTRTHLMFCLVTDFAPYSCLTRGFLLTCCAHTRAPWQGRRRRQGRLCASCLAGAD